MSKIEVKISGLNLARLVNKLVSSGIFVEDLVTKKRQIRFKIYESELDNLKKICKLERKQFQIVGRSGFMEFLKRMPYFLGTAMALVITFAYIFSFSTYVFEVETEFLGSESYDMEIVNSVLAQNNIVAGMRRSEVDISKIQTLLLLSVDDIEACTVELSGGKLKICVFPATLKYEISTEDVVSQYNAVIVSAEAYVGKLLVKVGDVVQIGDVLIENEGEGAMGKIEAKVYFTTMRIYNSTVQEVVRTGNFVTNKEYIIFGKNLTKGNFECGFSQFLTEKCSFYLMRNFFIPLLCVETTYYETEILEKTIEFEEVQEEICADLLDEARKLLPEGAVESNVTYSIVSEGTYTRVDCFVETILNIA